MDPRGDRRADVVILTAIRLEFDAVRKVHAGGVPQSNWEEETGPSNLPVAFRSFLVERGRPLRVALAVAPDIGATAAVNTLLPLVNELNPRCIAMCGVCAGRRDKGVQLGDVVAADRVYYHDTGKQRRRRVEQDLTTYNLRDDWKVALEGMDAVARFRDEPWFQARPLTTEWRLHRALVALYNGVTNPWDAVDPAPGGENEWPKIVTALRERRLLRSSGHLLTKAGRRFVEDLLFRHRGTLPALSPDGRLQRFRLYVAPVGSGARVIEDERIWTFVSQSMRRTLGIEMEAAAVGELAHRQRQYHLDWIVMKGVMDFADHGRDDHFKEFAARASAECLLWFLRDHVPTEVTAGFDDLLTPGTLPLPDRLPAPSILLNARYAVVPWHEAGRSEVLAELDAWADDPSRDVSARLLHAEGGVGKTRLAIEWVQRRRGRYDAAGFLVPAPDSRWLERLCGLGTPVMIVMDYAENRADLEAVLQSVAAFSGAVTGPRRRIRVLLLARSDGDWWKTLLQKHLAIAGLLTSCEPIKLLPLAVTLLDREAVFAEASQAFATHRRRLPAPSSPIDLDDARFERVLYLHMAAFAAAEAIDPEISWGGAASTVPSTFDATSLMDEILAHEERFWRRAATDRAGATIDLLLARQLVAAATLRGGLATQQETRKLCEQFEDRPRDRADDTLIALLHDVYDCADRRSYLPGLEPDLLGEAMVLRVVTPPPGAGQPVDNAWIDRVVVASDAAHAVTTAFSVLGRASAMNAAAVRPWIARLLRSELASRAVYALRAAKVIGRQTAASTLGDVLAEALERDGSASIAFELAAERIPYATASLRRVAEWQSRKRVECAPIGDDDHALAIRAPLLVEQGIRLGDVGQRDAALVATSAAVDLCRTLVKRNPHAFQRELAGCLNNLGHMLSEVGQREAALAATSEAVNVYRRLVTSNPDEFPSELATGLHNLGIRLSELGQREGALAAAREAVDLHRTLAARDPDVFQPELAATLNGLGSRLSELGEREAALAATREAAEIYRSLAAHHPDAFEPVLANTLNNLSNMFSALGRREPAAAVACDAENIYKKLTLRDPEVFQPMLAAILSTVAIRLSELGQRTAALAPASQSAELYRRLASYHPDAFQPYLAASLSNLAGVLGALGERGPALAAAAEAVQLYRVLADRNSDRFAGELAGALGNAANMLSEFGQREAALIAGREAVELCRTLASHAPSAFSPALAQSLSNLSSDLSAVGQRETALSAAREAVDLYRALIVGNPEAFQPALATSLNNLGIRFGELNRHDSALPAIREAVDIRRLLAASHPQAFQPHLASSLNNLGITLNALGQREAALDATREALNIYRTSTTGAADVFRPDLARTVENLSVRLSEQGQSEAALAAAREAVDLYRAIVADHPPFRRELARSLDNLAAQLRTLGSHELAQAATDEAEAIRHTRS